MLAGFSRTAWLMSLTVIAAAHFAVLGFTRSVLSSVETGQSAGPDVTISSAQSLQIAGGKTTPVTAASVNAAQPADADLLAKPVTPAVQLASPSVRAATAAAPSAPTAEPAITRSPATVPPRAVPRSKVKAAAIPPRSRAPKAPSAQSQTARRTLKRTNPKRAKPVPARSKRRAKAVARARAIRKAATRKRSTSGAKTKTRKTARVARRQGNAQVSRAAAKRARAGRRAGADPGTLRRYGALVRSRVQSRLGRVQVRARVVLSLRIAANGRLQSVRISQSSGQATLDRMALAAARRASPFPKPPAGSAQRQRWFVFGIVSR